MDPSQYVDAPSGVPAGTPATSLPGSISTPQQVMNGPQGIVHLDSVDQPLFKSRYLNLIIELNYI